MPYRDFWQEMIDVVYDTINSELNTQEEIDAILEDEFSVFYGYGTDVTDIPLEFERRRVEFLSPVDLIRWIQRGKIPPSACYVTYHTVGEDRVYKVYVSPNS